MVIAFEGYAKGNKVDQVIVPVIHVAAGMLVRSQIFYFFFLNSPISILLKNRNRFALFSLWLPDIGEFCIGRLCNRRSSSLPCGISDSFALWENGLAKIDRKPEPELSLNLVVSPLKTSNTRTAVFKHPFFYLPPDFVYCFANLIYCVVKNHVLFFCFHAIMILNYQKLEAEGKFLLRMYSN